MEESRLHALKRRGSWVLDPELADAVPRDRVAHQRRRDASPMRPLAAAEARVSKAEQVAGPWLVRYLDELERRSLRDVAKVAASLTSTGSSRTPHLEDGGAGSDLGAECRYLPPKWGVHIPQSS